MTKKFKEIVICYYHSKQITPLIPTLSFRKNEWWCPYCGFITGMFGLFNRIKVTKVLLQKLLIYRIHSYDYLDGMGGAHCAGRKIDGVDVRRENFPSELIAELKAKADKGWAPHQHYKTLNDVMLMKKHLFDLYSKATKESEEYLDYMKEEIVNYANLDHESREIDLFWFETFFSKIDDIHNDIIMIKELIPEMEKRAQSLKDQKDKIISHD